MARFNHIDGYYINADLILYIMESSSEADGPKDTCTIYFADGKSIYISRTAGLVATLLSKA
jgi:hypothetical protein